MNKCRLFLEDGSRQGLYGQRSSWDPNAQPHIDSVFLFYAIIADCYAKTEEPAAPAAGTPWNGECPHDCFCDLNLRGTSLGALASSSFAFTAESAASCAAGKVPRNFVGRCALECAAGTTPAAGAPPGWMRTNAFLPLRKAPTLCTAPVYRPRRHAHCHIIYQSHTDVNVHVVYYIFCADCVLSE